MKAPRFDMCSSLFARGLRLSVCPVELPLHPIEWIHGQITAKGRMFPSCCRPALGVRYLRSFFTVAQHAPWLLMQTRVIILQKMLSSPNCFGCVASPLPSQDEQRCIRIDRNQLILTQYCGWHFASILIAVFLRPGRVVIRLCVH